MVAELLPQKLQRRFAFYAFAASLFAGASLVMLAIDLGKNLSVRYGKLYFAILLANVASVCCCIVARRFHQKLSQVRDESIATYQTRGGVLFFIGLGIALASFLFIIDFYVYAN